MFSKKKRILSLDGVIADILDNLTEEDVENVKSTKEEDLIYFHRGWGTDIRNKYLHGNKRLMQNIGTQEPDDASGIIIRKVWEILRGETSAPDKLDERDTETETETVEVLTHYQDTECLEFSRGGTSFVIRGVPHTVAVDIAIALKAEMISQRTIFLAEDVVPRVVNQKAVTIEIWKYPKHPDNQE